MPKIRLERGGMKRKDIRLAADEEKQRIYEQIDELYRKGSKVSLKEHRSGFPAITVDCENIHILTDCLSLEQWYHTQRRQ
jgi:hypothetical protein